MRNFVLLFVILCSTTRVTSTTTLVLDSFTDYGFVTFTAPTEFGYSIQNGSSILGVERDMILHTERSLAGTPFTSTCNNSVYYTEAPFGFGAGVTILQYDGEDHSIELNPSGLGSMDLTAHGMSSVNFDAFVNENYLVNMYIYSGSNTSECYISFELIPQITYYNIPYNSFYGECKFNNVGAIMIKITFSDIPKIKIGPITFTNTPRTPSSTVTPSTTLHYSSTGTQTPSKTPTHGATATSSPTKPSKGTKVIVIDNFIDPAPEIEIDVPSNPTFPIYATSISNGTNIIGYERDMKLTALTGQVNNLLSVYVQDKQLYGVFPYNAVGNVLLQYDGTDNSTNLSINGLNNFDGTAYNANGFYFELTSNSTLKVYVYVYSGNGGYCSYNLNALPTSYAYVLFYNNFDNYGCSFSNIGAIELEVANSIGNYGSFTFTNFYTYSDQSSSKNLQRSLLN